MNTENLILGAGIAGLAYANEINSENVVIAEKESYPGGLCHSFNIEGFTFDSAVHLSFTQNEKVRNLFEQVESNIHLPLAYNFYHDKWIKHPIVNNLYKFSTEQKVEMITSFVNRPQDININNYRDWLNASYGKEFTNKFYEVYTQKYWTTKSENLSTSWIGNRLGTPDIRKILQGAFSESTEIDYYAKEMRYPKQGGYQKFIEKLVQAVNIQYKKEVKKIQPSNKCVVFQDGTECFYEHLISSIPLPILVKVTEGVPENVKIAANSLVASKISLVSVGFNKPEIAKYLWYYIYDEDIMAARVNCPSVKSINNAPTGCSSMQFEIYHNPIDSDSINEKEIVKNTKYALEKMKIASDQDILFMDYRLLEYGNVIFYNGMEKQRDIVKKYFEKLGIELIGRFGEWDYLWSDQSYLSGVEKAKIRNEEN